MAQQFLRKLYRRLKSEGARYVGRVGLFAVAVTIVSYWISYQDRIAARQNAAWDSLRAAISWTEAKYDHYGNFGQLAAIQTLTRDCDRWWRGTFLEPAFELIYHDCSELNSVVLARMDLGKLQAARVEFSGANFSCTNLQSANFRNATLIDADFHGAYMAQANLRGANLTGDRTDLRLANMSHVLLDSKTQITLAKLKCACISDSGAVNDNSGADNNIIDVMHKLKPCPAIQNTCEPSVMDNWACAE